MFIKLGNFQFSLDGAVYETEHRENKWQWMPQGRLGKSDALQYTGEKNETRRLTGTIFPHYRGGLGQIDKMRDEARKRKPLLLVESSETGASVDRGYWVIESIAETPERFMEEGHPLKIKFNIQLKHYGERL